MNRFRRYLKAALIVVFGTTVVIAAVYLAIALGWTKYQKTDFRNNSELKELIAFREDLRSPTRTAESYRSMILESVPIGTPRKTTEDWITGNFERMRFHEELSFSSNRERYEGLNHISVLLWERGEIPAGGTHYTAFFIFSDSELKDVVIEYDHLWL